MQTPINQLSDEQLVNQFANFHYNWLKSSGMNHFAYVEELRKEVLQRMQKTL